MAKHVTNSIAAIALAALTATPIGLGVSVLTADMAYAKSANSQGRGGGGGPSSDNGRGAEMSARSNASSATEGSRGQSAMNAKGLRGALASEFRELNAAHASLTGRMSASESSMPGRVQLYAETGGISFEQLGAYNDAGGEYKRLTALSLEEIESEFGSAGYEALTSADLVDEDGDPNTPLTNPYDTNDDGVVDARDDLDTNGDGSFGPGDDGYDDYAAAVTGAYNVAQQDQIDVLNAYGDAVEELAELTDRSLTEAALTEFNRLLGLDPGGS